MLARDLPGGTLASVATQLQNLKRWNREFNWGFSDSDFSSFEAWGDVANDDPRRAQLVTLSLGSVGATFDAWWQVISQVFEVAHRFPQIRSDAEHLRLWNASSFTPCRIRLVTIDLLADRDLPASTVRDARVPESAGLEVLASVAQFHEWVQSFWQFSIDVAGCELNIEERGDRDWGYVPAVTWKAAGHPAKPVGIFLGATDEAKIFSGSSRPRLI